MKSSYLFLLAILFFGCLAPQQSDSDASCGKHNEKYFNNSIPGNLKGCWGDSLNSFTCFFDSTYLWYTEQPRTHKSMVCGDLALQSNSYSYSNGVSETWAFIDSIWQKTSWQKYVNGNSSYVTLFGDTLVNIQYNSNPYYCQPISESFRTPKLSIAPPDSIIHHCDSLGFKTN